jgi:hypothetical protein
MKKQKFMKLTAYLSEPNLANSFYAPATHDGEISVVFREKDVSIHGYDGSTWSTIYTWNGTDRHFTFDNTYQNYFLKSLTGGEETMGVSFFSTSRYQGSTPSLAGVDRGVKLYDIDEVPIYTASDVNKMLTIMSDGSLRWLLANESFIIPTEGGEGGEEESEEENSAPTYPELTATGAAAVVDGQIQTNDGYFTALWSDFVSFTGDTPDNTDFTVAFWWKHGETPVTGLTPQFALFNGRTNSMNEGMNYFIKDHWTSGIRLQTNFGASFFAGRENLVSEDPNVEHPWNHFVFTRTATATKTYWNGVQVASHGANFPWVPNSATAGFQIGATDDSGANSSQNTLFEDFEIRDGEAMSQADITALYDAGRVSQQSGGGGGAIPGTFIEELATAASNLIVPAHTSITNGIFTQTSAVASQKGATKVDLNVEGIMNYSGNSLDPKEWTLSFWIAAEAEISGGHNYCGGRFDNNKELRLAMGKTGDGFLRFQPIVGNLWTGTPKAKSTIPFAVGQFQHCAITYGLSPGYTDKYDLKIFIDGVKGGEALQKTFHVLDKKNGNVWFGIGKASYGSSFNGNGGMFSLDSVQLAHGALTEAQVAAIAAQSDRQMSIETAETL